MSSQALGWLAIVAYICVSGFSIAAWYAAVQCRRPASESVRWIGVGAFFICIVAMRFFGIEESFRTNLRAYLIDNNKYFSRWEVQAPAAAVAFTVIFAGITALFFLHPARRPPVARRSRVMLAQWLADLAVTAMSALIVLRMISLHSIDALLYHGLHLNWMVDVGSTALALYGAHRYHHLLTAMRPH